MAHLVYRPPLLDERARGKYIQTRKELTDAKNRGDIDAKAYKNAKKNLEQSLGLAARTDEGLLGSELGSDASLKLARSASVSSGSTDSRTNESSSQSGGLSRSMTGVSTAQKSIRKGTIFDRNNIGRLVYKEDSQSVEAREAMKVEVKARKELKRLMDAYEASQNSVSSSYFNRNISRTSTPLPVEDEGYSPRLAAESSKFYSTEPLAPLDLPSSSTSSSRPKKNFNFFKWNGNRKNSSASGSSHTHSDASMSPISPAGDEIINTISATPRVDIDLGPPRLSLASGFNYNLDLSDRARSMSVSSGMIHRSGSATSHNTQFSTAPSSMRRTTTSGSSASSAILAQRTSSDTLRSASTFSGIRYNTDPAESISRFSYSSGEHDASAKPAKRTMADLFLFSSAGSASKRSNRETFAFLPSSQNTSVVRFQQGKVAGTVDPHRPKTARSSKSLRRRHSIGSDFSVPISTSSRTSTGTDMRKAKRPTAPVQRSWVGNEDAFASMFCAPKKIPKKTVDVSIPASPVVSKTPTPTVEASVVTAVPAAVSATTPEASVMEPRPKLPRAKSTLETSPALKDKAVCSSRILSLPVVNVQACIGQACEYLAPTTSPPLPCPPRPPPPPSSQLDPLHDPLPAPPSSILLDAFISLLEEYSSAPKLFSFSRPKAPSITSHRTAHRGRLIRKGSFVSTTHSVSETIAEEASPTSPTSPTTSTRKYLTVSQSTTPNSTTDDEESSGHDDITFYDSLEEADFIHEKQKLESVVWFLSASKWLSFGRLLFSPGHHLLCMGQTDAELLGLDDMRILDLDGPALGGWSWHLAHEYPAALVYNITTSKRYFENYGLRHMQPLNHRLALTESLTSLQPLESNSFDVITARALPRILQKHQWIPLLKECHRVLKPDGYIEVTIVDTVLNNMGPVTRVWIEENIIDPALSANEKGEGRNIDLHPSKSILHNLESAGLVDIHKCWVWMPAGTIGDELSSVTSRVGRYFYDELFGTWRTNPAEVPSDIKAHRELGLWNDPRVQAECVQDNTAFRWLKCHARKGNFPQNLAEAYF